MRHITHEEEFLLHYLLEGKQLITCSKLILIPQRLTIISSNFAESLSGILNITPLQVAWPILALFNKKIHNIYLSFFPAEESLVLF